MPDLTTDQRRALILMGHCPILVRNLDRVSITEDTLAVLRREGLAALNERMQWWDLTDHGTAVLAEVERA